MASSNSASATSGVGFGTLLFLVFLVLKLTKVIAWSWWWVTCPLWSPIVLVIVVLAIIGIWALIAKMMD